MTIRILRGDCRTILPTLPDNSVQCCVTSPPYYGLRDYGVDGQIGLEPTPDEYVAQLVEVFREVRRVLRADGTCWLNLGDSYAGSWGAQSRGSDTPGTLEGSSMLSARQILAHPKGRTHTGSLKNTPGLKPKDLIGIPWMVAFALRADGWWLRKSIIWAKGNAMPESVFDRPTSSHENVFLLTKAESYAYDWFAIAEQSDVEPRLAQRRRPARVAALPPRHAACSAEHTGLDATPTGGVRNARDVWTINVQPFAGAHFATMPPALAERCIRSGTPEIGCCPHCQAPWERIVVKGEPNLALQRACGADAAGSYSGQSTKGHAAAGVQDASDVKRRILEGMVEKITGGWQMTCACPIARPVPCTVLDPFGGAGTTALAADRLNRHATIIELNAAYAAIASDRVAQDAGMFAQVAE